MRSWEIDDLVLPQQPPELLINEIPTLYLTSTELLDRSVSKNQHFESSSSITFFCTAAATQRRNYRSCNCNIYVDKSYLLSASAASTAIGPLCVYTIVYISNTYSLNPYRYRMYNNL
jgi:hypothetical protein